MTRLVAMLGDVTVVEREDGSGEMVLAWELWHRMPAAVQREVRARCRAFDSTVTGPRVRMSPGSFADLLRWIIDGGWDVA